MSFNRIKKYRVDTRSTFFKVHNPTTSLPPNTLQRLQKRWIGPHTLKTVTILNPFVTHRCFMCGILRRGNTELSVALVNDFLNNC